MNRKFPLHLALERNEMPEHTFTVAKNVVPDRAEFTLSENPGYVFHVQNGRGLSIRCGDRLVVTLYPDGRVEIPEGAELDETASKFWEAVRTFGAHFEGMFQWRVPTDSP